MTRGTLETLALENYPGLISILTKSPLVVRDIDVLKRLSQVEVGMTVTTTDDRVSRWLEVRAPQSDCLLGYFGSLKVMLDSLRS